MAAQGLALSSIPRAIVLQTHTPVSQFHKPQIVRWGMASRPQQLKSARCFWPLPFCPVLRCGDFWSGMRSSSAAEGRSSIYKSSTRAGPSPADQVDQRNTRKYNFETVVLEPKGEHLATVVWLHGFSDSGARWAAELKNVGQLSPNIRWIIPTAPLARNTPVTAWFEFRYGQDVDMEGLDRSAETVAKLLLNEKTRAGGSQNVKLAVGGFSQGCATALYITACSVLGKYGGSGKAFPVKVDAVIGLSGWMPTIQILVSQMARNREAAERARRTAIFIGHCNDDGLVPARLAKASSDAFQGVGFNDITLRTYPTGGHSATSEEIADVRDWIATKLGLEKSHSPSR